MGQRQGDQPDVIMQMNIFLRPERTGFFPHCIVHLRS
jgi:hypothetical protein